LEKRGETRVDFRHRKNVAKRRAERRKARRCGQMVHSNKTEGPRKHIIMPRKKVEGTASEAGWYSWVFGRKNRMKGGGGGGAGKG